MEQQPSRPSRSAARRAAAGLLALAALAGPAAAAPTAEAATTRAERVSASGELVGGPVLRGSYRFRVPRTWERQNATEVPRTLHLATDAGEGCRVRISVSVRGTATARDARDQAVGSAGGTFDRLVASGRRRDGAWAVSRSLGPDGQGAGGAVYAIGVARVEGRKYAQLRAFASYRGTCRAAVVDDGAITRALTRVVREARTAIRVVPRPVD